MSSKSPEKKRKRNHDSQEPPSKRPALDSQKKPSGTAVKMVKDNNELAPVLVTMNGQQSPRGLHLHPYLKPRHRPPIQPVDRNKGILSSELLLQSSEHAKLDFIGRESYDDSDTQMKHYVAILDPQRKTWEFVEVRKMVLRASLRRQAKEEETPARKSMREQRMSLIDSFGTKQSRKAAQSMTENSVLTTAPSGSPNAIEAAIIASIPAEDLAAASKSPATIETELRATKPIPPANVLATHPSDVYPIDTLVPNGLMTLHQLPVKEWKDTVVADLAILTVSRYVSRRVEAIAKWGTTNQLQILRYMLILIEFSLCLKRTPLKDTKSLGPDSKKLPPQSELRTVLSGQTPRGSDGIPSWANTLLPESVIDAIRGKFAPHGAYMSKADITLLHTTICALSLHIPPMSSRDGSTITRGSNSPIELVTDTADLRDDLLVQDSTVVQYFRELGCRVNKPREAEFAVLGIKGGKVEAAARRIARLSLPLEFPKSRHGGKGARRKR